LKVKKWVKKGEERVKKVHQVIEGEKTVSLHVFFTLLLHPHILNSSPP
jgi:hypothetical protein